VKREDMIKTKEAKEVRETDVYRFLEREFEGTFIEELIPGILHNFANPLNGIIGRTRLLQRRLEEAIRKTRETFPEAERALSEDHARLLKDIDLITHESDRLFDLFKHVSGKFYAIGDRNTQQLNISELVENEIRFFDFYLDFKHNVKKIMDLDGDLHEVSGSPADYSMFISTWVRYAMESMRESPEKEFFVSTTRRNGHVVLKFQDTGRPIPVELKEAILKAHAGQDLKGEGASRVLQAVSLLRKYGVRFEIDHEAGINIFRLEIPCQPAGVRKKAVRR
jgi:signal transduction histidine kinase